MIAELWFITVLWCVLYAVVLVLAVQAAAESYVSTLFNRIEQGFLTLLMLAIVAVMTYATVMVLVSVLIAQLTQ